MSDESTSVAFLKTKLEQKAEELEAVPRPEAAGLQDDNAVNAMIELLRNYPAEHPDMPNDPKECRLYRDIVEHSGTHALRQALKNDSWSEVNFWKGVDTGKQDLSGYETIRAVESLFKRWETFQMYIFGPVPPVGSGKSNFALLLSEIAERVYDDLDLGTNITSTDAEVFDHIESQHRLEEWLRENAGEKLFILDEGSQALTSHEDQKAGIQLSKFLKLIRKHGGNIIIIGHTGRDIARDVRRQLIVCKKHDKYTATIGYGLDEEDEQIQVADPELELENIPETNRQYNHLEESEWNVDGKPDENEDGGEMHGDKQVKCRGTAKDGEACGTSHVTHKSGYCRTHRDQWDEDDEGLDPRFEE